MLKSYLVSSGDTIKDPVCALKFMLENVLCVISKDPWEDVENDTLQNFNLLKK